MAVSLTLLGTGCGPSHVPPSLLLCCAHTRYVFGGAGDGTQRMATEAHLKLAKLSHVFLTAVNQQRIGGITGQTTQQCTDTQTLTNSPSFVLLLRIALRMHDYFPL
jgi:ribonuclease BN (tRNA processing enzyme)